MKKVLVILTILILVAGSVFGAEVVRLKSVVESRNPTFALRAGLSPDSFNRESDDDATNTLGWETIEKSILQENIVVYFQIVQKGVAKGMGTKFALSIETSEMILELNEDGSPLAPETEIHRTSKGSISNLTAINGEDSSIAVTLSGSSTGDTANIMTEYMGKVEDGTPIATFMVTWAKDVQAPDGIYQASVILRVSPQ